MIKVVLPKGALLEFVKVKIDGKIVGKVHFSKPLLLNLDSGRHILQLDSINGKSAPIEIYSSDKVEEFIFMSDLSESFREGAYVLITHNTIENNIKTNECRNPAVMNRIREIIRAIFLAIILLTFILFFYFWAINIVF